MSLRIKASRREQKNRGGLGGKPLPTSGPVGQLLGPPPPTWALRLLRKEGLSIPPLKRGVCAPECERLRLEEASTGAHAVCSSSPICSSSSVFWERNLTARRQSP